MSLLGETWLLVHYGPSLGAPDDAAALAWNGWVGGNFFGLSGADEKLGLWRATPTGDNRKDVRPGRAHQHLQLGQVFACALIGVAVFASADRR